MKNILITGGAGFIGSNLALQLLIKGYCVTVLDNLSPQIHGDDGKSPLFMSIDGKVDFIQGDVRNRSDWQKALNGQDAVVHLAAETGTGQSMYDVEKYVDVNIRGTALLLDILANEKHTVKKVVVASSRAIYGEGRYNCAKCGIVYPIARKDEDMQRGDFECSCPTCNGPLTLLPTDETSKIHPTSIYGITKQNQEQMVMLMGESLNIPTVAFRYQNVYGPGQSLSNPYTGILSIFSTLIKNGKDISIFEDGKESRDFVYIDDVVRATIAGLEKDSANHQVFGIGADEPIDVITVANSLIESYNAKVKTTTTGNYRVGDIRHNYADISKAKELLNYSPQIDFKTGINLFSSWVNRQEIQTSSYDKSMQEMKEKGLFK